MASQRAEDVEGLDDTMIEEEQVQFLSPRPPQFTEVKLTRCTSTPMHVDAKSLSDLFVTSPVVSSSLVDSGFESADSDLSSAERSIDRSRGAIPKRTVPVITRSRTRQWSGSLDSSSHASFDLRKYPKDDSGIDAASIVSKKIRIVYRPGLFEGRESCDIIRRLADMGTLHILRLVWRYLTEEDLARALQVSTSWNEAVLADPEASERYIAAKEKFSENALCFKGMKARLAKTSPRKPLSSVSNLLLSPVKQRPLEQRRSPRLGNSPNAALRQEISKSSIVSPSKFRHKLFTEAAQRLGPDEKLQPCPRCTCPSRVQPSENRASCSRISCQFTFCTLCMCSYHHGSPCRLARGGKIKAGSPTGSTASTSSAGLSSKARVSSKQSKRRLKRL